jgi:GT2 family glycosyltransferase
VGVEKDYLCRKNSLVYSIVVCTKNRPDEIRSFLENLRSQQSDSLKMVIVVDGSAENDGLQRYLSEGPTIDFNSELITLSTRGGKPTALNLAMTYLENNLLSLDATVFLDDDITFKLVEIEKGVRYLKENGICGLSPLIINEGDSCRRKRFMNRQSIFPQKPGALTRSGENRGINAHNIQGKWKKTDWLPGGASIYDWNKIRLLRFSEQLENPDLNGYALGDDVDFSIRASEKGVLGCLQEIQVIHSSPSSSYRNPTAIAIATGRWKAFLVTQYPDKFSKLSVVTREIMRSFWRSIFRAKPKISWHFLINFLQEFVKHTKY